MDGESRRAASEHGSKHGPEQPTILLQLVTHRCAFRDWLCAVWFLDCRAEGQVVRGGNGAAAVAGVMVGALFNDRRCSTLAICSCQWCCLQTQMACQAGAEEMRLEGGHVPLALRTPFR